MIEIELNGVKVGIPEAAIKQIADIWAARDGERYAEMLKAAPDVLPAKILEYLETREGISTTMLSQTYAWGFPSAVVARMVQYMIKTGKLIKKGKGVYLPKKD